MLEKKEQMPSYVSKKEVSGGLDGGHLGHN